ncbi:MAG: Disulfide bond formation protein D precursor [Parcubacteria bacterium OLB19]|nr:MAG: Disulfide bond formation protein D precursor [Parcubacteria bacterium OLB19]
MNNPWVIIGIIVVLLIGGSVWYSGSVSEKYNEGVDASVLHVKGNPDATVTLVEYSDFQCPACAAAQPVVKDIMNEFGNEIKFEYKHFPLPMHPLAEPAARAAEAAGQQGKFFEFHDMLFEKQKTWSNSPNPTALFVQYAEELGLDVQKFRQHMNASLLSDRISADKKDGEKLGITGTPTFFLNGEKMQMTSYNDFYEQIARAVNPDVKFDLATTTATGE